MTTGSNFWVIGGEFGSMNFHKLVEGSAQVKVRSRRARKPRMLARGLGREPSQGRRALLHRGRALAGDGLTGCRHIEEDVQGDGRPHPELPGGAVRFSC